MDRHFPACFVELPPSTEKRRAAFYLAAEEWVAKHLPEDSYLFTWQLGRTVVMGRNQVAHQEIDLDFCRENHIDVIRRKSGGGAIFADEGNIMVSLVTPSGKVEKIFREYADSVAAGLNSLGAAAEVHGRNDIILSGKGKICGNAFYHMADRNIVHGTMLYDTDPALMQGALYANPQKLKAKGVQSIRARVGVLRGALNTPDGKTPDEEVTWLRGKLREILTNRSVRISEDIIPEIEQIEQTYYEPSYLYGSSAGNEITSSARVEGCGTLGLHFILKGSIVKSIRLTGDFFEIADAQKAFSDAFCGVTFTESRLTEAIAKHHPERSIRNLNDVQLADIIKKATINN
jgi:lipoate-protein ligase A